MYVDALICVISVAFAFGLRSKASVIIFMQNAFIFCLVYLYWFNSGYWHVEFLPDFHLSLALVNISFLAILYATPNQYHLLKSAGALLVLLNVAVFFYIEFMNGSSSGLAVVFYPFIRLLLIAVQLVGIIDDADRSARKRRKLYIRRGPFDIRASYNWLSFTKIHK